jgi:hypothetical protein
VFSAVYSEADALASQVELRQRISFTCTGERYAGARYDCSGSGILRSEAERAIKK